MMTETLTCASCGHSLTTEKTVGKPDSLEVKCPACRRETPLRQWRNGRESEPAIDMFEPLQHPKDESRRSQATSSTFLNIATGLLQLTLLVVGLFAGLVVLSCTASICLHFFSADPLFDEFHDDNAYGKTANEIQVVRSELQVIRNLFLILIFSKIVLSVVNYSRTIARKIAAQ